MWIETDFKRSFTEMVIWSENVLKKYIFDFAVFMVRGILLKILIGEHLTSSSKKP